MAGRLVLGVAYDTILFDLDGTLTDSGPGILDCVRHALSQVGHPGLPDQVLREFVGPPLLDSFQRLAGLDPATSREAITVYRRRYTKEGIYQNSVYPGIRDLLAEQLAHGRRLAVATSKATPYAQLILDHFELSAYFVTVVGADLDGTRAAKSQVVAEALRQLGARGAGRVDRRVLVGDRGLDVIGARDNGIDSVGVLWGYGTRSELTGAGATHLVATPADLALVLSGAEPGSAADPVAGG